MATLETRPHCFNGHRSRHGFRHAKLGLYMCVFAVLLPRLACGHFFSAPAAPVRTTSTGAAASSTKAAASAIEEVFVTTKLQRPWNNYTMRILYVLTAVNPALSVIANDYNTRIPVPGCVPTPTRPYAATVYRTLFYFARLKPRLLFTLGAMSRALQLSTALQFVFDPAVGVGAGLNLLSLWTGSRWPAPVFLGWAASAAIWTKLGARSPEMRPVPIALYQKSHQRVPITLRFGWDKFRSFTKALVPASFNGGTHSMSSLAAGLRVGQYSLKLDELAAKYSQMAQCPVVSVQEMAYISWKAAL